MPEGLFSDRSEKLAAAKRKLKSFQSHQQRHSVAEPHVPQEQRRQSCSSRPQSATLSHCSIESLGAESSKSMPHQGGGGGYKNLEICDEIDKENIGNLVTLDSTSKTKFHHDEVASAFARVKFPTQSTTQVFSEDDNLSNNVLMQKTTNYLEQTYENVKNIDHNSHGVSNKNLHLLAQENVNLKEYCSQLCGQLEELNKHYGQLHAAYSNVSQNTTAKIPNMEQENVHQLKQEIKQHLQTMTVLVQEKSDLQSQLKQTLQISNQKSHEVEQLRIELKSSQSKLSDLDNCKSTNRMLEESLERQSEELNRLRKDGAQLQARLTESLQDKSESYAKYKQRCKEFDTLLAQNNDLKQQLAMKDIYLQQISGDKINVDQGEQQHSPASHQFQEQLSTLHHKNEILQQTLQQLEWENEQCKERYEFLGRQMRCKMDELTEMNEKLSTENFTLHSSLTILQNDLVNGVKEAGVVNGITDFKSGPSEAENNGVKLEELNVKVEEIEAQNADLKRTLADKDQFLAECQEILHDKDRRIQQLEEYLDTVTTVDSNAKSLLEQLHNEKAATSRSMSQNLQLKRQLQELEDKFVAVTNEEMNLATKGQSLEHSLKIAQDRLVEKQAELDKLTLEFAAERSSLKNQVNQSLRQEYDQVRLEDSLRHYSNLYENSSQEFQRAQNQIQLLEAQLEFYRRGKQQGVSKIGLNNDQNQQQQSQNASDDDRVSEGELEEMNSGQNNSNEHNLKLETAIERLNRELDQTTHRIRRLSAENQELHRIMEQNAADENQNTIHVELSRAVERCAFLADENENLRHTVQQLTQQVAQNQQGGRKSPDDHSSICSEHMEQNREQETMQNLKSIMEQLQQRLKRALDQNADLHDQNEQLEHLIVKLQSETETIGEYVTLYRHQRQMIRDKLKEKDEYVAKLSRDNTSTQSKLNELQNLVVDLLKERRALATYDITTISRHPVSPHRLPSKIAPRPKTLSETSVDETAPVALAPTLPEVQADSIGRSTSLPLELSERDEEAGNSHHHPLLEDHPPIKALARDVISAAQQQYGASHDGGATVEKILKILTELQKPDLINQLPPVDRNLHCKYCRGRMIVL